MSRPRTRSAKTRLACQARSKDGHACKAAARASGWCWRHDPGLAGKRKAAERRGGRRRAYAAAGKPPDLTSIDGIRRELAHLVAALKAMDRTVPVARALTAALGEARGLLLAAADLNDASLVPKAQARRMFSLLAEAAAVDPRARRAVTARYLELVGSPLELAAPAEADEEAHD